MRYRYLVCFLLLAVTMAKSQTARSYKQWDPAKNSFPVLEGQSFRNEGTAFYGRLPEDAEKKVRHPVWGLSKNSAGLKIRFISNTDEIIVKYTVSGKFELPHMPATGVSGVDLYAKDSHGRWLWCSGRYKFQDTIVYHFQQLLSNDEVHKKGREYHLYLPLYNTVTWMQITVPEDAMFIPQPVTGDKPIVVYGTSIAQGACASRPGLAWTSILNRKMDRPVINLAFSGNGRLEKEVIGYINEIEAKVFVLDCLPNLTGIDTSDVKQRIVQSVNQIRGKHPETPILLVEHCSFTDEALQPDKKKNYESVNAALKESFRALQSAGTKNIHLLTQKELGQDIETMVDGIHPNDLGMMRYAEGYEKALQKILLEPGGHVSTMIPVTQYRDAAVYDWNTRHEEILSLKKTAPVTVFMGNSITHFWGGEPRSPLGTGSESWNKYFAPLNAVNLGYGWDRIENVLWRVYHGELDGLDIRNLVLNIGTNNLSVKNTDEEIVTGLRNLIAAIRLRKPSARIFLLGIYPRRNMEDRVTGINKKIEALARTLRINYLDPGSQLLQNNKKINESLFTDGLHPNARGYEILGSSISKAIGK